MSMTYEILQLGSSSGAPGPASDNLLRDIVRSKDPAMLALYRVAEELALADIPVLIVGESGSGKEILTREILRRSSRADKPFLKIRCGRLSQAHNNGNPSSIDFDIGVNGPGTVLLDGIEELPLSLQRSLLHWLDSDGLPVWDHADAGAPLWRVISTSSRELNAEIGSDRFRADLYYRLNGICLRVPPLRERREDIEPLALFFAGKFSEAFGRKRPTRLSRSALKVLVNYRWPGNIRELQNVVQRVVLLNDEERVLKDLRRADTPPGQLATAPGEEESLSLKKATRLAARRVEQELIQRVLLQTRWNRKQAAEILGISYKALLYKVKQSGLKG